MSLIEEIILAFQGVSRPAGSLFAPKEQDEGEEEYFSDKTWEGHSVEALRYHEVAMGLFTQEAHQYFLPAFMIASLENPEAADVIPDHILYHFSEHEKDFWKQRILILSEEQKIVVSKFLEQVHGSDEFHKDYLQKALQGLKNDS